MSNKHVNHQHGLSTMNATRPKSKLWKRKNKAAAKERKEALLKSLSDAVSTKRGTPKAAKKAAPKAAAKKMKA